MVALLEYASRTASCAKNWPDVLPHAPNVFTTSGINFQPSSKQMGSLHVCFLSSVCLAAAPATTPASDKMLDLSVISALNFFRIYDT